ncbi:hypothetical protein P3X46_034614 [Hevea brasiliensis]|uniref:Uncharacterized protein n=1 Tax=Hevea brasiliensis TaxID=3981 RepID=A0ABQ9KBT6_HEVBR|nr:hypothetical protein P3X46_034614 [Hevea brasiliensis]
MDTIATGKHAWAPSIDVLLDDDDDNGLGDNVKKAHSKDAIRLEGASDSEEESNFLKDLDQIVNNEIQAKLSQQIDRLVATVKSRVTITSKRNDLPGCTIPEVYEQLNALSKIEEGNELWLFTTEFLEMKSKREMCSSIKKPKAKLTWLKHHQAKAKM